MAGQEEGGGPGNVPGPRLTPHHSGGAGAAPATDDAADGAGKVGNTDDTSHAGDGRGPGRGTAQISAAGPDSAHRPRPAGTKVLGSRVIDLRPPASRAELDAVTPAATTATISDDADDDGLADDDAPNAADVQGIVLLIHGGKERSREPVGRFNAAAWRMRLFTGPILDRGANAGIVVGRLFNRLRGWNEPDADPVLDAQWALDELARRFGEVPIVLVGHSMGGRVALRVAGHPRVRAVAALAPWLPEGEPVAQLTERTVLIAHGDHDRVTNPRDSLAYARRAAPYARQLCHWRVSDESHAMLRRPGDWHRMVADFALGVLGAAELPAYLADALATDAIDLGLPIASRRRRYSGVTAPRGSLRR